VAETFLRRWFGKAPDPAADEARAEIDRLLPDRPTTRGPLLWLRDVLDDLVPDPRYLMAALPTPAVAREECHAGRPLLRHTRPGIDSDRFAGRWRRIVAALDKHQPGAVPSDLATAAGRRFDQDALLRGLVDNRSEVIRRTADELGTDPGLFGTLLRFTLFAGLTAVEAGAAPLRQGAVWDRGDCPTCGQAPLLAEFRGLDQSRHLRCGWCAASWEAARQWCPACGSRDHEALGYLAREGEEDRYRVATCDACKTGVKTLSTLSRLPPLMLLVADAATLHLDLAAADRGYHS
jgi:FdhE protein